jgi:hypothetical protein
MTAEVSPSSPDYHLREFVSTEPLTLNTYNGLLAATRELHHGAKVGQLYDGMEVIAHTDNHTQMTAGHEKLVMRGLIIEDIPYQGVLLRNIQVSPTTQGGRLIRKNSILLSGFAEQPKILRTASPILEADDPVSLAQRILAQGEALSETTAALLTKDLHELQSDVQLTRQSKIASLIKRLNPLSW